MIDLLQRKWLQKQFEHECQRFKRLSGGKNNAVWCFTSNNRKFIFKHYFADDSRRCLRETQFVSLLNRFSVRNAPLFLTADQQNHLALFEFINGNIPKVVDEKLIMQAAQFSADINAQQVHNNGQDLLDARGALFTTSAFFNDVDVRLKRLMKGLTESEVDQLCAKFIRQEVCPLVAQLKRNLLPQMSSESFIKVLSPSDFGFHNCLVDEGRACFIDFEYAGWDSAEKLLSDFFAQPRFDIPMEYLPGFIQKAFGDEVAQELTARVTMLLPVSHIKWCLIFLNEFIVDDLTRREFAQSQAELEHIKQTQLAKARQRLNRMKLMESCI